MSDVHLRSGSQDPPRVEGLLRLYSMLYCPFAQRPRLVLKAKGIPHEIVNINLYDKPQWYVELSGGKVPALRDGTKIILESLDICDYLEDNYPDNPLYPAEPEGKRRDKELIGKVSAVIKAFASCCHTNQQKTAEEWLPEFLGALQVFEDELSKRGTTFFGGDKPGMVDFMLWPWGERYGCVIKKFGKNPIEKSHLPLLCKWKKSMMEDEVCKELMIPVEKHLKIQECKLTGAEPLYDSY